MSDADRLAEIDQQMVELRRQIRELEDKLAPLREKREKLLSEQARLEYPDGPFALHVWRHFHKYEDAYDEPLAALRSAGWIADDGSGAPEKITDRHGNVIYDISGYPPKRVAEGYPEVPDD